MGNLSYKLTLDNEDFKHKMQESSRLIRESGKEAERANNSIQQSFKKLAPYVGTAFSVAAVSSFAKEVINVRGEMELLEASFETLVGKAGYKKFLSDLKSFAVESPLSLTGVSSAAQMLIAFGVDAEKVIPIVKQLGDVSMGNEERFRSLALAYSQMSSAGQVLSQDLRQMATAGFNPLTEIARTSGKSIQEVTALMSKGKITVEQVADAFKTVTDEGGKFHNMTKKQADGIRGLQNQLQGVVQETLNKIGSDQQGIIAGGYKAAIMLVESYEKIGKVLASIITVYGVYRAALIAHNVATIAAANAAKGLTIAEQIRMRANLASLKVQQLLNKAMLTNPYVAAATAVAALAAAIYLYTQRADAAERATKSLNKQLEDQKQKTDEEKTELQNLIGVLKDETSTRIEKQNALSTLQKLMPSIFSNLDIEKAKSIDLTDAARQYNEQLERRNYLENKQKVESAQQLLASKEGDWRWKASEQQQALALMGKNSSLWAVANTPTSDIIDEFKEWIKQADRAVKDYEISFVKSRLSGGKTKPAPTSPTTPVKEKAKKEEYDATLEIMQAGIDAMEDGYTKQEAQIRLNHQKRIADIYKRGDELTKAEQETLSNLSSKQLENELNVFNNDILTKYQSFADKKLEIETKFEKDRKELISRSNADNADETARAISQLETEKNIALEQLAENAVKNNEDFQKFVNSIVGLSLTELQAKLASVWMASKLEIARNGQTEKASVLQAQYDELAKAVLNLSKESDKPVNEKGWSNTVKLMNSVKKSVEGITDSFDGLDEGTKSVLNAAANIAGGVISMISGIELLAKSGAEAVKGVERASVILAVISAGLQIVTKIFSFLSRTKEVDQKVIENYNRLISVTDELIDKQKELLSELSGTNAAIKAQQALLTINKQESASRELGKEYIASGSSWNKGSYGRRILNDIFNDKDKKELERVLRISISSLGNNLSGLFDLSIEQLEKLKYEAPTVWAKLGDEVTKYLDAIIETDKKREEILSAENVAKTGLDLDEAKNSLDDFLTSADRGFGKITENWTKYTKNALLRAVKEQYLNAALENWYKQFAESTEGGLTESETDILRKSYEAIAEEARKRYDEMIKATGMDSQAKQGEATYGAYEKITQDQASSIDGRLTGIQMSAIDIANTLKTDFKPMLDGVQNVGLMIAEDVSLIKDNTKATANFLKDATGILNNIKNNTDRL